MKISHIESWEHDLKLSRPYKIAGEVMTRAGNAFIKIELANGTIGLGAASPSQRVCGESLEDSMNGLSKAADLLKDSNIMQLPARTQLLSENLRDTPAALAAVDMALYDAIAKMHDLRIVDYFGACYDGLETSITIGIKEDAGVEEDLEEYLARGFRTIKVKIGDSIERDLAILNKIREWGGGDINIRVDANQGYDLPTFTKFVASAKHLNLEFVEQPIHAPALETMRRADPAVVRLSMADEDLLTEANATDLLERPIPYGLWNIKLMKSGGITTGKWIGDLALHRNIPLMWGCMDESIISIAAALHTAYSCKMTRYLDLDGSFDLEDDIVKGGFRLEKGRMYLTDAPGLGVQLL